MEQEANEIMDSLGDGLEESASDTQAATVLFKQTWHPGIVGLVASRVKEKTRGAVICFSPEIDPNNPETGGDPDWLKGSGRSDNVHLRDTLAYVAAKKICSTSDRSMTSQATGRSSLGAAVAIGGCERTRWTPIAPMGVTPSVIGQKSADGIIAECPS
jgi:hypothetical protein